MVLNSGGKIAEERGYIAGRAWLYSRKSAVILPEERGYIEEERGYIPGRARLYFCNENSGQLRFCLQPSAAHGLRSDQYSNTVSGLTCFPLLDPIPLFGLSDVNSFITQ